MQNRGYSLKATGLTFTIEYHLVQTHSTSMGCATARQMLLRQNNARRTTQTCAHELWLVWGLAFPLKTQQRKPQTKLNQWSGQDWAICSLISTQADGITIRKSKSCLSQARIIEIKAFNINIRCHQLFNREKVRATHGLLTSATVQKFF